MPIRPPQKPTIDASHLLTLLLLVASLGFSLWLTDTYYMPELRYSSIWFGYDGMRYHVYAEDNSSRPIADLLSGEGSSGFSLLGYPTFLTFVYALTTPHPWIGCIANWMCWVGAGVLLSKLVENDAWRLSRVSFLGLWLLYPESTFWCGYLLKETLVVFLISCSMRVCYSVESKSLQLAIVGVLAYAAFHVRTASIPMVILPLATSFAMAKQFVSKRVPRAITFALTVFLTAYFASGEEAASSIANPLARAGTVHAEVAQISSVSSDSMVHRLSSPSRLQNMLYVPARGLGNILFPLFLNLHSSTTWESFPCIPIAICICVSALWEFISLLALVLRITDRWTWTFSRSILVGVTLFAFLAIGMSGLIHERYRSLITPGLIPLGACCIRDEIRARGLKRLVTGSITLPLLVVAYEVMRYGL